MSITIATGSASGNSGTSDDVPEAGDMAQAIPLVLGVIEAWMHNVNATAIELKGFDFLDEPGAASRSLAIELLARTATPAAAYELLAPDEFAALSAANQDAPTADESGHEGGILLIGVPTGATLI